MVRVPSICCSRYFAVASNSPTITVPSGRHPHGSCNDSVLNMTDEGDSQCEQCEIGAFLLASLFLHAKFGQRRSLYIGCFVLARAIWPTRYRHGLTLVEIWRLCWPFRVTVRNVDNEGCRTLTVSCLVCDMTVGRFNMCAARPYPHRWMSRSGVSAWNRHRRNRIGYGARARNPDYGEHMNATRRWLLMYGLCAILAKLPVETSTENDGGFPKRSKGPDCKSGASCFSGSNPLSATPR